MPASSTVLVLGGGVGGVTAATSLRKKLTERHRVVIVDRERNHLFAPSLLWLMTGQRTPRKISRRLDHLARKAIEVIHGDIARIDPETRRVRVVEQPLSDDPILRRLGGVVQDLEADHVVVSLGAELAPEIIPGLTEAGHNFYSLSGAESFREALAIFNGGRIVVLTATPAYKCPAAPYEAAMLIDDYCRRRAIGDNTQIDLYAAEPGPMGVTGPEGVGTGAPDGRRKGNRLPPGASGDRRRGDSKAHHLRQRGDDQLRPPCLCTATPGTAGGWRLRSGG